MRSIIKDNEQPYQDSQNYLISLIVPVYNVEEYLRQCLESIVVQDNSRLEVILVDDGSTDSSGLICDEYAFERASWKVVHKDNKGLSSARNFGIEVSSGEYIIFLDSDDFLVENSLENITRIIEKRPDKDIYFGSFLNYYPGGGNVLIQPFFYDRETIESGNPITVCDELLTKNIVIWSVWRHVFSKKLLDEFNLRFDVDLTAAEDVDFFLKAVLSSKSYHAFNDPICYYRRNRPGAITTVVSSEKLKSSYDCLVNWFNYFDDEIRLGSNESESLERIRGRLANMFFITNAQCWRIERDHKELFRTIIKENEDILDNVKGKKYKVACAIYKMLGFTMGSFFLDITLNTIFWFSRKYRSLKVK